MFNEAKPVRAGGVSRLTEALSIFGAFGEFKVQGLKFKVGKGSLACPPDSSVGLRVGQKINFFHSSDSAIFFSVLLRSIRKRLM